MLRTNIAIGAVLVALFSLTACGETPEESIHIHLEKVVELEEQYGEQQEPLSEAEEAEHKRFEEMVELGLTEMDQIEQSVSEALEYATERVERMELERESLESAHEEFENVEELVASIENQEVHSEVEKLVEAMQGRFSSHAQLYEAYIRATELDKELYQMFLDEEMVIEDLQTKIDAINEEYAVVEESKEAFNEYTNDYNEAMEGFYSLADL